MYIEKKRESILFVISTFLLTGICWGSLILFKLPVKQSGGIISNILYMVGGLSPTIIALLLPIFTTKGERRNYYKRYFKFAIPLKWFLIPIVSGTLMISLSYGFTYIFFEKAARSLVIQPLYMLLPLFISMLIGGGLEEIGWRGILVHNFKEKNPVLISIGIGALWASWHTPLFFIMGTSQYHTNFIPFFINVIALSLITSILYLKSGSVIPCIIFHALINAFGDLGIYFGDSQLASSIIYSLILLVSGIAIFAILNLKKNTTRIYEKDIRLS